MLSKGEEQPTAVAGQQSRKKPKRPCLCFFLLQGNILLPFRLYATDVRSLPAWIFSYIMRSVVRPAGGDPWGSNPKGFGL